MVAEPLKETSAICRFLWQRNNNRGIPKDKRVIFSISKVLHFTFSKTTPGLVTTRESIDCLVGHDFRLLQRTGTIPPLPSSNTPAYAGKVPINDKKYQI